jgi:putative acetyltransferase
MTFSLRSMTPEDNPAIAAIIRAVMPEFGADGPGFAIHDAEVNDMFGAYSRPGAAYFVIEMEGRVLGGGGVAALDGGEPGVCELRKMYFLTELRGRGAGLVLIERCLDRARELGYRTCYLETLSGMDAAQALYQRVGFRRIPQAMGKTGHFGCNRFYAMTL